MNRYRRLSMVLFIVLMFVGFSYAAFYQISFRGFKVSTTSIDAGGSVDVESNIVNLGENPRTDITVKAMLIRNSDKSVVFTDTVRNDIDLAGREVVKIKDSVQVPEDVPEGDYSLTLRAVDASGITKAFVSEDVSVNNDREISSVSFGNKGVYLLAERIITGNGYTRTYEVPSYGTQGENILPGSNFSIKFNLENTGTTTVSPEARIKIVPTYADGEEPVKEFTKDLGDIAPGKNNEYEFESRLLKPGTYELKTQIVGSNGKGMGSSQVRLVIAGEGGSITDLANSQDTYDSGETVKASATVVGPADGSTTVNNADLKMEVLKNGEVVTSDSRTIDTLPLSPKDYQLSVKADQELTNYSLRVTLGKEGTVYDTYEAEYQPLEAEKALTESGQIRQQNACYDNGVCTEKEFEMGSCYDCINVSKSRFVENKKEPDNTDQGNAGLPVVLLVSLLILLAGGAAYWRWNQ